MAKSDTRNVTMADGSLDFSSGVNSYVVPTVQSVTNPNGLPRNAVAWMDNATVRGGGITQRTGWLKRGALPVVGLFQGKFLYEPDTGNPYFIYVIDGNVWMAYPDHPDQAVNLSLNANGVTMPATLPRVYFEQAEMFLVIQAGDGVTLPLFWDGALLRRSKGLLGTFPSPPGAYTVQLKNVDAVAGTVYPDQTVLNSPLGVAYSSFTAPAIGADVLVNLATAYAGAVGDTVTFPVSATGQMQLMSATPSGGQWLYTYQNLSIPSGTSVPAQYAVSTTPGDGANLPAFTAPAIGATINFLFPTNLINPGLVNVFSYVVSQDHYTVDVIANGQDATQATVSEIPSATCMKYYMGRLWYAQGRQIIAGDIVQGTYGTQAYNFRDSVLKVTENPLAIGGDGFTVPSEAGNITAIAYAGNINVQLGQGMLYIFTRKQVYSLTVPVSRTDWINATSTNQPLMAVVQITNGSVNDRSVVEVNGDLFYQSLEPAVRSLQVSVRNFQQWGNVPISIQENRILQFNDRSLLGFASGIEFDNRMIQTALPYQTPVGVAHQALIPLNFDVISTLATQLPPVWEGMYEGMPVLELAEGDFGGLQRAFATVWSDADQNIQIWELTTSSRWDKDDNRVEWYIEFPAFTWGNEFELKKLVSAELWMDKILGTVNYFMDYRPDGDPCWYPWHQWELCTSKNECENVHAPVCVYPKQLRESFRQTITLPLPPNVCESVSGRPANLAFQIQCRLRIKGWSRVRGLILKAEHVEQGLYSDMIC